MKARVKLLAVAGVIAFLMINERPAPAPQTASGTLGGSSSSLQQEIQNYESIIASGQQYRQGGSSGSQNDWITGRYSSPVVVENTVPSNFFSRLGRSIGSGIQLIVRRSLQAFARFFNNAIG